MHLYESIKSNLKSLKEEDEFTELHREIVKLKGEKYWDSIMDKSNGHIGIPGLRKILADINKKSTKKNEEPKVEKKKEEPKLSEEEKEIKDIEERLQRKDLKGQERTDLENDLRELKRGIKEADSIDNRIYYFMVGICLDKNRPNAIKEDFADWPWTKIPYKLLDENWGVDKTKEEAVSWVKNYIADGVPGTFGVVFEATEPYEGFKEEIYNGNHNDMDWSDIQKGKLIYSAYKEDDSQESIKVVVDEDTSMQESESFKLNKDEDDFEDLVKRDFKLFLLDNYNDEEYKDVTEDDINTYFTGMFYDIFDYDDMETANLAEDIIRREYGFEDKLTEAEEVDSNIVNELRKSSYYSKEPLVQEYIKLARQRAELAKQNLLTEELRNKFQEEINKLIDKSKLTKDDIIKPQEKKNVMTKEEYLNAHKDKIASYDDNVESVVEYFLDSNFLERDELKSLDDETLKDKIRQTMNDMWDGDDDVLNMYIQNNEEPYDKIYDHDVDVEDVLKKVKERILNESETEENVDDAPWFNNKELYDKYKDFVGSLLSDGAIDDPEYVKTLSKEEFEDLLVNTWMKDKEIQEEFEDVEGIVPCGLCDEYVYKDDCKKEMNLGWLCPNCQNSLYSRGEKAVYAENLDESDTLDKLSDDDIIKLVDSFIEAVNEKGLTASVYVGDKYQGNGGTANINDKYFIKLFITPYPKGIFISLVEKYESFILAGKTIDKYELKDFKDIDSEAIPFINNSIDNIFNNNDISNGNKEDEIMNESEKQDKEVVWKYLDLPYQDFKANNTIGLLMDKTPFIVCDDNLVYLFDEPMSLADLKYKTYQIDDDYEGGYINKYFEEHCKLLDDNDSRVIPILVEIGRMPKDALDESEELELNEYKDFNHVNDVWEYLEDSKSLEDLNNRIKDIDPKKFGSIYYDLHDDNKGATVIIDYSDDNEDYYEKVDIYFDEDINESEDWEKEEPIECTIEYDEDGRPYFMYNNEKEYIDEYMRDDAGGAIKPLSAFSAIRIVPSDNGETVTVEYLHESEETNSTTDFEDFQDKNAEKITKEYFKRYGKVNENEIDRRLWEEIADELYEKGLKESEETNSVLSQIKDNLEAIKNNEERSYEIYGSALEFPSILEKIDNVDDRRKALMMLYMNNPKLEELKTWTAKQIKDYILDTEEVFNINIDSNFDEEPTNYRKAYAKCFELIGTNLNESEGTGVNGMTITQYAQTLKDNYIDQDVCDTDIDMLVALVYNFNEEPTDYYDKFIKTLCDKTKVEKINNNWREPILICKFTDVFKPYNEECKDIFNMDYSEFGEDEAYYEAVANLEPLIAGNASESTYKDMYDLLNGNYKIGGDNNMNESVEEHDLSKDLFGDEAANRMSQKEKDLERDLQYVRDIMAGKTVIDDKYHEELSLDTAKAWLRKDFVYVNDLSVYSPEEINKRLADEYPDIFSINEAEEKPAAKIPEPIMVYMNTWKNYNEYGADLDAYGIKDGWMTIDDALEFCKKYAEDEPFINDIDNNTNINLEVSEYDNAPSVLEGLKELNDALYLGVNGLDLDDVALVYEAWSDKESVSTPSLEKIEEFIDYLNNGEYYVHNDITSTYDIGKYYVDNVGYEGVSDIENYIDEDQVKEDWQDDINSEYEEDSEDWYEVDDSMVEEDIEQAVQANNTDFFDKYFDYESLGDDIYDDGYWYVTDNGSVEIY